MKSNVLKMRQAKPAPRCDDCGFTFDRNDQRGVILDGFTKCPLCYALSPTWCEWSVKNDCNGIFETFERRRDAQEACRTTYAHADCYVVPSVVLEIPDDGIRHWGFNDDENRRDARDLEWSRREIVGLLRGRSV